jgi:hypothetical protein
MLASAGVSFKTGKKYRESRMNFPIVPPTLKESQQARQAYNLSARINKALDLKIGNIAEAIYTRFPGLEPGSRPE